MSNGKGGKTTALTPAQKIMVWAKGRVGKQVGRGECWDLGEEALKQAGAMTSNDLNPGVDQSTFEDLDYVWGDEITNLKDVQRGDILQIRDHLITTITVTEIAFTDGSTVVERATRVAKRGHHTAIARSTPDVDGVVKTYEQHVNGRNVVQKLHLHTRSMPEAVTRSTGKRRHPKTGKLETVKVRTAVTVEVSGKIWAYRPKPK